MIDWLHLKTALNIRDWLMDALNTSCWALTLRSQKSFDLTFYKQHEWHRAAILIKKLHVYVIVIKIPTSITTLLYSWVLLLQEISNYHQLFILSSVN